MKPFLNKDIKLKTFSGTVDIFETLSTSQISYERYAAEQTIRALDEQIEILNRRRHQNVLKVLACDTVLKRKGENHE